jgi:hypothetical protein
MHLTRMKRLTRAGSEKQESKDQESNRHPDCNTDDTNGFVNSRRFTNTQAIEDPLRRNTTILLHSMFSGTNDENDRNTSVGFAIDPRVVRRRNLSFTAPVQELFARGLDGDQKVMVDICRARKGPNCYHD